MKFKVIDFQEVRRDLDTGASTNFNTNFHTAIEAPDLPIPTNTPYSFGKWLPLIMRSRGLPPSALKIVSLSRAQVKVLVQAAAASVHTRVLNRSFEEDLHDEVWPAFDQLTFPPEGLFMRLGDCSPKDGAHTVKGRLSLHSVDDILLRLTTSLRALSPLNNMLNHDAQEIPLFFLPFDSRMRPESEYRVFCTSGTLNITGVSQYRWHKPWIHGDRSRDEMEVLAGSILDHIKRVHAEILEELQGHDQRDLVFSQGFTFDVLFDEESRSGVLVELNTFGVRSACGSCLFQWLKDRNLLYGELPEDDDGVEFRVTL